MPTARMPRRAPRAHSDAPRALAPRERGPRTALFAGVNEAARKRLVSVVLVIYLLAIFEGAIRKYLVPQLGQYVFFIRDPFLIYAYVLASRFALWPRHQAWCSLSYFLCGFGVVLFFLQVAAFGLDGTRVILGVYGWRSYFLYIPLAFLMGAQFRREDVLRFARLTLLLAVPMGLLVLAQFASSANAPINVGVAEDQEFQFKSVGITVDRIRTTGTFTSPGGQAQFIAGAFALLLGMLLLPKPRPNPLFLALGAAGLLTCAGLSGSRGAVLSCGVILLFAIGLAFVGKGGALKLKAFVLPMALVLVALALYPVVFPEGFSTFMTRWDGASQSESASGGIGARFFRGLIDFTRLIGDVPALGYGLGYGGNASIILGAKVDGVMVGLLAEADFTRHMVDLGPIFGACYIVLRLALIAWLGKLVLNSAKLSSNPMPMMTFSFASLALFSGQITGLGTANIYCWLFVGLCIASAREASLHSPRRAPIATRFPLKTTRPAGIL